MTESRRQAASEVARNRGLPFAALALRAAGAALLVCACGCGSDPSDGTNKQAGVEPDLQALHRHWRACTANFTNADIPAAVARDFARGETRYFGQVTNEYDYAASGLRNCMLAWAHSRPEPDSSYLGSPQGGRPDLGMECGMAVGNYEAAYNREQARSHPETLGRNCIGPGDAFPPGLDRSYMPSDIASYRSQMERLYGP